VELPGPGDVARILGDSNCFWQGVSVAFFPQNHGKYYVGVDMHHADGQALIRRLAVRSDVVVENFKPGTTEAKWGLGYRQLRELNPRLIYVANTGFGQWGPFAEGPASYDGLAQAVSGLTGITGFEGAPPIKSGNYLGDWFGPRWACWPLSGGETGPARASSWRRRNAKGSSARSTGRGSTLGSPGGIGPGRVTATRRSSRRASTGASTGTWPSWPAPMRSSAGSRRRSDGRISRPIRAGQQPDSDPVRGALVGSRLLRAAEQSRLRTAHARRVGMADDADAASLEDPGPTRRVPHRLRLRETSRPWAQSAGRAEGSRYHLGA
jgi:CoA-transferase family III